MPSLTNQAQLGIWQYLFNATPYLAGVGTFYVSLHNGNPGEGGSQSTYETTYSNYVRVAVPRSPGSLAVAGGSPVQVQNIQQIVFPACGPTGDVVTYWGLGLSATSPGTLITSGPLVMAGGSYGFTGGNASGLGVILVPALPNILFNQPVMFYAVGPGMLLPGNLVEGVIYYVGGIQTALGGGVYLSLSATPNNLNPVSFSYSGSGVMLPCSPMTVVANTTIPTFPPGNLIAYLG